MKLYANDNILKKFAGKPLWVRGDFDGTEDEYFKVHSASDEEVIVNMIPAACVDEKWNLTSSSDRQVVEGMFNAPLAEENIFSLYPYQITLTEPLEIYSDDEFKEILKACFGGRLDI